MPPKKKLGITTAKIVIPEPAASPAKQTVIQAARFLIRRRLIRLERNGQANNTQETMKQMNGVKKKASVIMMRATTLPESTSGTKSKTTMYGRAALPINATMN